jgi:bifunctional NMN adenylyltransferase/nudix hydrolase
MKRSIGVIVGRFQTPELHEGHKDLIEFVRKKHQKVLIILGSTPNVLATKKDPLDFWTRKLMIQSIYPDALIIQAKDHKTDEAWSANLDRLIHQHSEEHHEIELYGSRDSFIPRYKGKYHTVELPESRNISSTEIRESVVDKVRETTDFRLGVIYGTASRHAVGYSCADIAVFNSDRSKILLARKKQDESQWRLFGGFFDPAKDQTVRDTARREIAEESGGASIVIEDIVDVFRIDDWRYRGREDCIISTLFIGTFQFGPCTGGDDIDETQWFSTPYVEQNITVMVAEHRDLVLKAIAHLKKEHKHGN